MGVARHGGRLRAGRVDLRRRLVHHLPFAVSAFVAAILAFYDVPIEVQWSVFVFGGAVMFVIMLRWAQHFMRTRSRCPASAPIGCSV